MREIRMGIQGNRGWKCEETRWRCRKSIWKLKYSSGNDIEQQWE